VNGDIPHTSYSALSVNFVLRGLRGNCGTLLKTSQRDVEHVFYMSPISLCSFLSRLCYGSYTARYSGSPENFSANMSLENQSLLFKIFFGLGPRWLAKRRRRFQISRRSALSSGASGCLADMAQVWQSQVIGEAYNSYNSTAIANYVRLGSIICRLFVCAINNHNPHRSLSCHISTSWSSCSKCTSMPRLISAGHTPQ
jgi:hypothetical protein